MSLEEGLRKSHLHVQAAAAMPLHLYDELGKDIAKLARAVIPLPPKKGNSPSYNVVCNCHPEDPALQKTFSKVTRLRQFGYATKSRHTCAKFKCDAPQVSVPR